MVVAFVLVVLVAAWTLRPGRTGSTSSVPTAVRLAVRILLAIVAVAALVAVVRAGHTGAQVAWSDIIEQTSSLPSGGR